MSDYLRKVHVFLDVIYEAHQGTSHCMEDLSVTCTEDTQVENWFLGNRA